MNDDPALVLFATVLVIGFLAMIWEIGKSYGVRQEVREQIKRNQEKDEYEKKKELNNTLIRLRRDCNSQHQNIVDLRERVKVLEKKQVEDAQEEPRQG